MKKNPILFASITVAVFVLALGIFLFRANSDNSSDAPAVSQTLEEGAKFPFDTKLEKIDGSKTSFKEFKGRVLLLNYWAAWCTPCIREMPGIYKLHNRLKGKDFAVVALSMDDNVSSGVESLKRLAGVPPFEVFNGQEGTEVSKLFPIDGLPFSVLVDKTGVIKYARPGELDWDSPEAAQLIESLL